MTACGRGEDKGGKLFSPSCLACPVKQDDFKGTSGNPEGL